MPSSPFHREFAGLLELKMMQSSKVEEVLGQIKEIMEQMKAD
jgi:hypothetical protein